MGGGACWQDCWSSKIVHMFARPHPCCTVGQLWKPLLAEPRDHLRWSAAPNPELAAVPRPLLLPARSAHPDHGTAVASVSLQGAPVASPSRVEVHVVMPLLCPVQHTQPANMLQGTQDGTDWPDSGHSL